ncbi:MAG: hypothetical protein NUW01_18255, partial [Gemmatimonadaceae bacterium]|nr:hypothetical protein [Gemmatimonadaceae bacterium]
MPDVTRQQKVRWSLFGRTPNEWAAGGPNFPEAHVIGRTERFIVGTTGRQTGKTDELSDGIDRAMTVTSSDTDRRPDLPPEVGILGANYEKAELSVFRYIENLTRVFGKGAYHLNSNKHELTIIDPFAGKLNAKLKWMSAEEAFNVVGNTFSWVGVDESQAIGDAVWERFLPTLDVRDAHCLIFGTPDTVIDQTWFQGLWEAGQDPLDQHVHSFTVASWEAPWMNIDRILFAKEHMASNEFRRLYGGEWIEDAGLVFTGYESALLARQPEYDPARRYVMAVDLAIHNDFNVVMVGDPITRTAIYRERWNKMDPLATFDRIIQIHSRFGRPRTWVDATGLGAVAARDLGSHLGPGMIVPVEWSSGASARYNKMDAIQSLAGDLQHRKLMFPNDWDDLKREMKSFVYGRSPTGRQTAAARTNAHDDLVMSLALLNLGFRSRSGVSSSGFSGNYLTGDAPAWETAL